MIIEIEPKFKAKLKRTGGSLSVVVPNEYVKILKCDVGDEIELTITEYRKSKNAVYGFRTWFLTKTEKFSLMNSKNLYMISEKQSDERTNVQNNTISRNSHSYKQNGIRKHRTNHVRGISAYRMPNQRTQQLAR